MFGSRLEVKRFEKEIQAFEARPMMKGRILLYGHSLFTRCITGNKWENPGIEELVLNKDGSPALLNHGFGTSSADDLLYYYHRAVLPYEPRAVVLATGGNDVGFGYSAREIMDIQARVIQYIKADFPEIPIYCMSRTPTLKNKGLANAGTRNRDEHNRLLQLFCDQTPDCYYVPLHFAPFYYEDPDDRGDYDKVREDIFYKDQVHLNPEGYKLFADYMRELLKDLL